MTTTFAERLKHAMNEAHMSQSELSSKTGITKASISQYLSGKNQPREQDFSDGRSLESISGFPDGQGRAAHASPRISG